MVEEGRFGPFSGHPSETLVFTRVNFKHCLSRLLEFCFPPAPFSNNSSSLGDLLALLPSQVLFYSVVFDDLLSSPFFLSFFPSLSLSLFPILSLSFFLTPSFLPLFF